MRRGDDRKRLPVHTAGIQTKTALVTKNGIRVRVTDINILVSAAANIRIYGGNDLLYIYDLDDAGMIELYEVDLFAGVGGLKISVDANVTLTGNIYYYEELAGA
jgi:hypothetical protein